MADSRIDDLRRRLERDPESRLFAQLAEQLRKEGELEEAIGVARAGLERHPAYPSARLTLGRALLDSGDPAAARLELEAAVQGAPENILASRLLGEALETLGDLGAALDQYGRTLQMAPGDAHVEGRIQAIQGRLGAPVAGAAGGAEVTEPTEAFGGDEEDEEEDLPPTIRIRMPGDSPRPGRAPLPPIPGAHPPGEVTQPRQAEGDGNASPVPTDAEVAGSELPATLPMPGVDPAARSDPALAAPEPPAEALAPESAALEAPVVEPPTVQEGRAEVPAAEEAVVEEAVVREPVVEEPVVAAEERESPDPEVGTGSEAPQSDPGPGERVASDLAPTLPKSRAAEFASADTELPPTLPPGAITRVEEIGEVAGATGPVAGPDSPPLSSATLAELYFEQGLLERALEVYRQVLDEDPTNEGARGRLAQIEKLVREGAADLSVPAAQDGDDSSARRRALERTVERLEALLEVVRRR